MMRWKFVALAMVLIFCAGVSADKPAPVAKQIMIEMRIWQGDPLGSRAAGTVKLLAESIAVTSENREVQFHSGAETKFEGEVIPSYALRINPVFTDDSKIKIRADLTYSEIEQGGGEVSIQNSQSRYIRTVAAGELVRLRFGKANHQPADKQTWAEITIRVFR